jgi:hypothetical protein
MAPWKQNKFIECAMDVILIAFLLMIQTESERRREEMKKFLILCV